MKLKIAVHRTLNAVTLAFATVAANAAIVTIEPDNYPLNANLSNAAPYATLSTFRDDGMGGVTHEPVLVKQQSWAPTGHKLFGHRPRTWPTTQPEYHWVDLLQAYQCEQFGVCPGPGPFYVFRVDFVYPTDYVKVWTTMLPSASDGAELWAFDVNGNRIQECRVYGVDNTVLATGVMPAPTYGTGLEPAPTPLQNCGVVLGKEDCAVNGPPGECNFIVTASIRRHTRDIAYVMWGGTSGQWTTSPVDNLSYNLTAP